MSRSEIVQFTRPVENSFAEGNILEHPIFKLSNKEARPTRANGLLAKEDYRVEYVVSDKVRIVVEADMHNGFPTIFALRVLLVVIDKAHRLGFQSRRVPIGRAEIARGLGFTKYGGHQYDYIGAALRSLRTLSIYFVNGWREASGRISAERSESLVTEYSFGHLEGFPQLCFDYAEFVELGSGLFESLRSGYRIAIDLDYLNTLKLPTAQRLYTYLTKKDNDRATYREGLLSVGRKLPLTVTAPSQVRRSIEPALLELTTPQADGKRFLQSYSFERSGRDTQLQVVFAGLGLRASVHEIAGRSSKP